LVVRFAASLLLVVLGGCATDAPATSRNRYFSLLTTHGTNQMALGNGGQIVGPNIQLAQTDSGYRGMANSLPVEIRSDGKRIQGTINDRVIDLHVELSPDGLEARGMFGGKLGRLEATNYGIISSLGPCHYELEVKNHRYEGQRACGAGGLIPTVRPAAVELPPGFERLRFDRQAMLLAIMLGQ
jgi:hypothetical protein